MVSAGVWTVLDTGTREVMWPILNLYGHQFCLPLCSYCL